MDKMEALLELERRGNLPDQYVPVLAEARKRGLIQAPSDTIMQTAQPAAQSVTQPGPQGKGFWAKVGENVMGDDDPTTQNFGEALGSFLNRGGESMTFGLVGDEAGAGVDAALGRGSYDDRLDHYRGQEKRFQADHPALAAGADIGGAMVLPGGAIGSTLKAGGGWLNGLRAAGASAAATGGLSGLYGFMEGEGGSENRIDKAQGDALIGGLIGVMIPGVGYGVQKAANGMKRAKQIRQFVKSAPTTDDLRVMGDSLYDAVKKSDVHIKQDVVRNQMDDISNYLRSQGAGYTGADKVMKSSHAIMDAAGDVGAQSRSVPHDEIDMFRRYMNTAISANPDNLADKRAVTNAVTKLDDFVMGLKQSDVDSGDLQTLQSTLGKAREVWSRMSRSQTIDDAIEAGESYLTGPGTGIKYQFKRILKNPGLRRGFKDEELAMMRRVVNGTISDRLLRTAGSGLTQIGGTIGAVVGGGPLAGIGTLAASTGARSLSDRQIAKNAEIVRSVIASGGLPKQIAADPRYRNAAEALIQRGTGVTVPQ